ncbi:hypothetical protein BC937DRAFT_92346 [Endogone sp. FLAS-F59071]|nr:hypothetical protein BC937DRAFT_92346 [Endogone sp. FLAS-F59071]|eukprot:RUS15530.1 hypothetical protein BC937DRAFT_92346 [Endogone sp. FLAS-F59071]
MVNISDPHQPHISRQPDTPGICPQSDQPLRRSMRIAETRAHATALQRPEGSYCLKRRRTVKTAHDGGLESGWSQTGDQSFPLKNSLLGLFPTEVLLYFLETLDGPTLAQMESTCRQLNSFINHYRRTLYCGLYNSISSEHQLNDTYVRAPLWPGKNAKKTHQKAPADYENGDFSEDKVYDWKLQVRESLRITLIDPFYFSNQFADTYTFYVIGLRCAVCRTKLQVGAPYYTWEIDMCKFCAVRNLINKGSLRMFGLTEADVVNVKAWHTTIWTIGVETKCIFYFRKHLELIVLQKKLAGVKPRTRRTISGGLTDDTEKKKRKVEEVAAEEELRRKKVDAVLKKKGLRVTDLNTIWFPKVLKHEFDEYITGKTDPSLKRQRTRQRRQLNRAAAMASTIVPATGAAVLATATTSSTPPAKPNKTVKSLKRSISALADDAEEYVPKKKRYVAITTAIKKAGFDFERDVEDAYQGHKALWKVKDFLAIDDAPFRTDTDVTKLEDAATVAREVVKILDDERCFRETILETFEGEEACKIEWVRKQCDFDRFYRKAREWWHSRARNIDVHRWSSYSNVELPAELNPMIRTFEDHVRGYSHNFENTQAVGARILRHQRFVSKTRALRRRIFDSNDVLRSATDQKLQSPKATAIFNIALNSGSYQSYSSILRILSKIPKSPRYQNAAITFIQRAETFHRKLQRFCPKFTIERATRLAADDYNLYVGDVDRILHPDRSALTSSSSSRTWVSGGGDPAERFIKAIRAQEKELNSRIAQVQKLIVEYGLKPKYFSVTKVNRSATLSGISFQDTANKWIYSAPFCGNVDKLIPALIKEVERQTKELRQLEVRDSLSRKYHQYVSELAADVTADDAVTDVIGLLRDLKTGKITKSAAVVAEEHDVIW